MAKPASLLAKPVLLAKNIFYWRNKTRYWRKIKFIGETEPDIGEKPIILATWKFGRFFSQFYW
jgi:hypothetical protein